MWSSAIRVQFALCALFFIVRDVRSGVFDPTLDAEQEAVAKGIFKNCVKENQDKLGTEELKTALESMEVKFTADNDIPIIVKALTPKPDGEINEKEFLNLYFIYTMFRGFAVDGVVRVFDLLSALQFAESDDAVDLEDLVQVIGTIKKEDSDANGVLSFAEFVNLMAKLL